MTDHRLKTKHKIFERLLKVKIKRFNEISDFQQDHVESINDADLDNNSIVENQTEQMMREARVENESLDHLKEEINYLEDYQSFKDKDVIGPSTVVKTNIGNFIVSVPATSFEVEGEKFTGISTKSPMYGAIEGKSEGDKVEFNGQDIEIREVI